MLEEIIPIILEVLIEYKCQVKIEDIIEASSCEKQEVSRSLEVLYSLNLVKKNKDEDSNVIMFSLVNELKAIHLAKAAQFGLDLSVFDNFFKIDPKEKELALGLATKAEKIKGLDLNTRKPLLQKRTYLASQKTDGIYENLLLLLEATNLTLYEYIEGMAEKDTYLKLLIEMHQQAENSLRDYHSLLK
jgi:DNA-binding transcriptional ArsR family regulator